MMTTSASDAIVPTHPEATRVLHVTSGIDARAGGTTTALVALAEAQRAAGLRVSVVSMCGAGDDLAAAERLRARGIDVDLIGPTNRPLAWHRDIKSTLARLVAQSDVVHIHALWEEIQHRAAVLARSLGKPYLISPHGMLDPWSLKQSWLKKELYLSLRLGRDLDRASAIHYADEVERDIAVKTIPLKSPALVERHVVDLSDFTELPPNGGFRAKYPLIGDRRIVLFLSRIHPKKGLDLLIPAFANAELLNAVLVIAGPDNDGYAETVKTLATQHGVADRTIFPGMLRGRERVEAMVDADLFVLPSYQENFGIVVIEALAGGLPVIISDQVNIHRTITAEQLGEVVPTQVDALRAAIERWMNDSDRRREVSDRAREFSHRAYSPDQIGRAWVEHYSSMLARFRDL